MCVCDYVCVCVCVHERERERMCVCVCMRERENVCERERVFVCVRAPVGYMFQNDGMLLCKELIMTEDSLHITIQHV